LVGSGTSKKEYENVADTEMERKMVPAPIFDRVTSMTKDMTAKNANEAYA